MVDPTIPAFLVACGRTHGAIDPEYERRATPVAEAAGLVVLAGGAVGESVKVLEGALPPGCEFLVVERFPSMTALEEFYFSPEYQASIPFRSDSVTIHFIAALAGTHDDYANSATRTETS